MMRTSGEFLMRRKISLSQKRYEVDDGNLFQKTS